MLKKLKNYQILDLVDAIMQIGERKIKSNKKFSYAVILNDEIIQPHLKAIQSVAVPSESYNEFETKRIEILNTYAKIDDIGNVVMDNNQGVVFKSEEDDAKARKEIDALANEYSDVLDERNKEITEYNELLSVEIEVDIATVLLDDIPDEIGEDIVLMKLLSSMIE
jgi:hypothetical protein